MKVFQVDSGGTLVTSLVAYYKLENANDFWSTFNFTGTGDTYSAGKVNNALASDGTTTHLFLSTSGALLLTAPFSVSFWLFIPSGGITSTFVSFVNQWNYPQSARQWTFDNTVAATPAANIISFAVSSDGLDSGTLQATSASTASLNNTWVYVVGTYDGTNIKLYLNNGTAVTKAQSSMFGTAGTYTQISGQGGNPAVSGWLYSTMLIDEVGIWSKTLSATEITDLYNGGAGQTMILKGTTGASVLMQLATQ